MVTAKKPRPVPGSVEPGTRRQHVVEGIQGGLTFHAVQGSQLHPASTLAWLVHLPLPPLAFWTAYARADQALWEKGYVEAEEAVRSRVCTSG